ncbi:hypothetical protein PENTCL1PPCAC_10294, partial [Pristionchus entomophagus]
KHTLCLYVEQFFESRSLRIDRDYTILVDCENGLEPRVRMENIANDDLKPFIELRHGLQLSSYKQRSLVHKYQSLDKITRMVSEKRYLRKQVHSLRVAAQIVHLLREPLNESLRDIRCDSYVERNRSRINKMMIRIRGIDSQLIGRTSIEWFEVRNEEIKEIAHRHGIDAVKLERISTKLSKKVLKYEDLLQEIRREFHCDHWEDLKSRKILINERAFFAISPDAFSEASMQLQYLQRVERPENENDLLVQRSNRFLDDCSFYSPLTPLEVDVEQSLTRIPGTSKELFAELNSQVAFSDKIRDKALIESAQKRMPIFLYPNRECERIARDLIESCCVQCSNPPLEEWVIQNSYDSLMIPYVYDPSAFGGEGTHDEIELLTAMQSSLLEFGSSEWTNWFAGRLVQTEYHPSVFHFYRRTIADREFFLRDEMLIERIRVALTDAKLKAPSNNLDRIRMDAFVSNTVEAITRGERLANIRPPFADEEIADKLAKFIRSRRMHIQILQNHTIPEIE